MPSLLIAVLLDAHSLIINIQTMFAVCVLQVKAMKEGKSADKPIYNHVTGNLDAPEKIESPNVSTTTHESHHIRHIAVSAILWASVRPAVTGG
jgi:hypothetical protein